MSLEEQSKRIDAIERRQNDLIEEIEVIKHILIFPNEKSRDYTLEIIQILAAMILIGSGIEMIVDLYHFLFSL